MDFDATFTYESGPLQYEEFPRTDEPLHILGERYSTLYDLDDLKLDILSRLWFTYRKNFPPIGGSGPSSDQGWGCMLRCGQMMLAQSLLLRHLNREWRWDKHSNSSSYWKVLRMFQDKKSSVYSIHQIASMGESEGKAVGQWFGPNTVAQVLKKMAVYDDWSSMVIHVAMDNTVIEEDIRQLCKCHQENGVDPCIDMNNPECNVFPRSDSNDGVKDCVKSDKPKSIDPSVWKPLLLIIPLRLGLTDINPVYFDSLKACLSVKQSVGIIGGKPNHAHWFIGHLGEELVYLDPHTTQLTVDLNETPDDDTFHCPYPGRMKIHQLDPSVAVGFFCGREQDFNDLCLTFRKLIIKSSKTPMFELHHYRPHDWPSLEVQRERNVSVNSEFADLGAVGGTNYDSEEEFELL
ncbi:cysteine protease ATG4B-like [Gigantopelta aegis]|uniref:cysteine protease ATG4B-like n=1 Tax=Gigantopelta aegis TaxID=1735272 RepID=UPI001B88B642|nr:cysteine protease ATG4B-like [Gigantopelta aegis]